MGFSVRVESAAVLKSTLKVQNPKPAKFVSFSWSQMLALHLNFDLMCLGPPTFGNSVLCNVVFQITFPRGEIWCLVMEEILFVKVLVEWGIFRQHMHNTVMSNWCFIFCTERESKGLCLQLATYQFKSQAHLNFCTLTWKLFFSICVSVSGKCLKIRINYVIGMLCTLHRER